MLKKVKPNHELLNLHAVILFELKRYDQSILQLNKSLELGRTLVLEDTSMINLLYPLTEFFQELLFIKIFKGTNNFRKSYTRLSPSVNKQLPSYAKNYKNKEIALALKRLEQIDKKLKTSRIKDESAITEFIYGTLSNG